MANERNYETAMVFSMTLGEEGIAAITEKFKTLIEANGTIEAVNEWGKRRLAYPINDEPDGYYVFVEHKSNPEFIKELDRVFNITDGVLRSLTIVKGE